METDRRSKAPASSESRFAVGRSLGYCRMVDGKPEAGQRLDHPDIWKPRLRLLVLVELGNVEPPPFVRPLDGEGFAADQVKLDFLPVDYDL